MQCAHCATPVPDDARFCHSCGSQVSDAEGQANATASMDGAAFAHLEKLLRDDTAGEFTVEQMLGRGGMAVVYLATEVHLHRKVALKVLPPELTFGHGVERFKREARTAAALDHPNIIPIYRVASGGKIFWYAMKFLEGRALDDLLKERGQFGFEETIEILTQVADALDYAHDHKVIHRDIKPANVMLDNRNRVVVTDFGIAKAMTEGTLTASGSVIGTPYYMSPEQGLGKPVTGAADQYSVAVMAYRMLAGEVPFEGDSAIDILHKHCTVPPPPLQTKREDLEPHVYRAVHRALAKNPEQRFPNVTAFVEALQDPSKATRVSESDLATMVLSAKELTNPPVSAPAAARSGVATASAVVAPPAARSRGLLWAAVAAVVLGGGGFAAWKATQGSPGNPAASTPANAGTQTPQQSAPAEPVAPPAPTTGVIVVAGAPNGSAIIAGGVRQITASFELPAGTIPIEVIADGYNRWTSNVLLAAGDTLEVRYGGTRVAAARPPPTTTPTTRPQQAAREPVQQPQQPPAAPVMVSLTIAGQPPAGATYFVDGVEQQRGRSIDVSLPAGLHQIRVVWSDGASRDTTVQLVAGEASRVILRKN